MLELKLDKERIKMKKKKKDSLPVVSEKKMIDVSKFVKLAKRVKKSFEEEEICEQKQSQYYSDQTRRFISFS